VINYGYSLNLDITLQNKKLLITIINKKLHLIVKD